MKSAVPRWRGFTLIELLVLIALLAILAAILFPVFAQARDKARQAACFSNLRQIGTAMALYLHDYDGRLPNCCMVGRGFAWDGWGRGHLGTDPWRLCAQVGITRQTPTNTFLGPEQTPPRYVQELLHPYVRNGQIWFCPGVGIDRLWNPHMTRAGITYGFNGTTYFWNFLVNPAFATNWSPFRDRPWFFVSGREVTAIPRPAEAPLLWDMPFANPLKKPCTSMDLKPAHARGVNVLYADSHAKFSPFTNHPTNHFLSNDSGVGWGCLEDCWAEHHWEGYFE